MNRLKNLKYFIIFYVIFGLLLGIFTYLEISSSRKEILQSLNNESINIIETINQSIDNTFSSNNEIEQLLIEKLNSNNTLINNLLEKGEANFKVLYDFAKSNKIDFVAILKNDLTLEDKFSQKNLELNEAILFNLKTLVDSSFDWIELGNVNNIDNGESYYSIAKYNKQQKKFIISGYKTTFLLEYRKKIGIGKQIQNLSDNPDIIYVVLQDSVGIISASKNIKEISSIKEDEFLRNAIFLDNALTRLTEFSGAEIYEIAKPIKLDNGDVILTRIAISLESSKNIQRRSSYRLIIFAFGLYLMTFLIFGYFLLKKKFGILKEEHKEVKSYNDLILENSNDAILAVSKEGVITLFNKSAENIFHLNSDDVLGKNYNEIFTKDELKINNLNHDGFSFDNQETDININNRIKSIDISYSAIKSEDKLLSIILVIRDLTEKKKFEEELKKKEKFSAMGELAGGVAHEIRNPLNAIYVIIQRLEIEFEGMNDKSEYFHLISTVKSEIKRINGIITQFLDFARPRQPKMIEASLNKIVNDSIDVFSSIANERKIRFEITFDNEFLIECDSDMLKQVFVNILKNSIEAITVNGLIEIKISKIDAFIEISIIDNGAGISKENLSKIFNLYFTTKSNGTGLGLAIVYKIVEDHNGRIRIESKIGEGTKVFISLPLQ
jgi:two-component system sensor histidine kinase HydH